MTYDEVSAHGHGLSLLQHSSGIVSQSDPAAPSELPQRLRLDGPDSVGVEAQDRGGFVDRGRSEAGQAESEPQDDLLEIVEELELVVQVAAKGSSEDDSVVVDLLVALVDVEGLGTLSPGVGALDAGDCEVGAGGDFGDGGFAA